MGVELLTLEEADEEEGGEDGAGVAVQALPEQISGALAGGLSEV